MIQDSLQDCNMLETPPDENHGFASPKVDIESYFNGSLHPSRLRDRRNYTPPISMPRRNSRTPKKRRLTPKAIQSGGITSPRVFQMKQKLNSAKDN